ncbi:MAG TPA: ribosome maturation factor RimP [Terriglobales bacterium]|nr:ribosome maturation factor RimP [Terriglobales bacterium]
MPADLDKVRAICDRVAASLGLEIVDVEFRGGAGKQGRVLRIYIDRVAAQDGSAPSGAGMPGANESASDGSAAGNLAETSSPTPSPEMLTEAGEMGVTLEDCANVSREVSTILDVEDVVPGGEYMLEVSSPGLDRKLNRASDFERFVGSRVKLMTRDPVGVTEKSKGNRHFEGRLEKFENGRLLLDVSPAQKKKAKPSEIHAQQPVEIELTNVERANLVPEI